MPSVVVATENEALNRHIERLPWAEVAAVAQYREAVADMVRTTKADVLLLSAYLKGSQAILEAAFVARSAGLRVVFLAGEIKPDDELIADLIAMGIYDILFNPINITQIEEALRVPGKFGDAVKLLKVIKKPKGRRIRSLTDRFLSYHQKEEGQQQQAKSAKVLNIPAGLDSQPKPRIREEKSIAPVPQGQPVTADQRHCYPLKPSLKMPKVLSRLLPAKSGPGSEPAPEQRSAGFFGSASSEATVSSRVRRQGEEKLLVVPSPMAARIWMVVGAAPRVGTTSFALALTRYAAEMGFKVKVADGGGGASAWVKNSDLLVPGNAEFAAAPGEITIVDAGCFSDDCAALVALAETAVWVTDLSPGSLDIKALVNSRTFLVGTRGAALRGLEELAEIRQVIPICALPEAPKIKEAQLRGELPLPNNWRRELKRCIDTLNVF